MQAPVGFRIIASGSEFEARVEEVVLSIPPGAVAAYSVGGRAGRALGRGAGGGGRHGAERRPAVAPGGHGRRPPGPGPRGRARRAPPRGGRAGARRPRRRSDPLVGRNNGVRPQCCVYCTSRRKRATEPRLSSLKPAARYIGAPYGVATSASERASAAVRQHALEDRAPDAPAAVLGQHDHVPDRGVEPVVLHAAHADEVAVILPGRDVPGRRQRALEGRVVEVGIRPACRRAERPVLGRSEPVALGVPHR